MSADRAQFGPRSARVSTPAPRRRRRPWWVLGIGAVSFFGLTGWVAAQPLPPSQTTPALKAVQGQIQQESSNLSAMSSQAQQWQAQRQQLAGTLKQEEQAVAQLTGTQVQSGGVGSGGSVNVPNVPIMTRAS